MFELLYTSVATQALSELELINLLEKAREKNQSLGITGMLIYHDREIMQILEGEESTVKALFQAIYKDNRHTSADIFYQGKIQSRAFSGWSMAFKHLDEETIKAMETGYEELDKKKSPVSMIKDNPNRGKKIFLALRETL